MKRALFVLFAFFPALAGAVSLDFNDAPLPQFVESVFRHLLRRDYIMTPSVAAKDSRVSVSVRDLSTEKALEVVRGLLSIHDVDMIEREGVIYLDMASSAGGSPSMSTSMPSDSPATPPPPPTPTRESIVAEEGRDVDIYVPRFQSVDMLSQVARFAGAELIQSAGGAVSSFPVVAYSGTDKAREKAREAMEKLDSPPLSVKLHAALIEVTEGTDKNHSLSGVLSLFSAKLGITFGTATTGGGGASITIKGTDIQSILSAFDGDSRFKYIAEPSLKVVDGQEARLVVGSEVPVRGSVTLDNNGNGQQSIEYKTAGVQLAVTPLIRSDVVLAKIAQEISSFSVNNTSGIDSPTILKRSASTTIDLHEGEVVMIAGLDESRETSSRSGLPFLPFDFSSSKTSSVSHIVLLVEMSKD
jgi:type II secretory pathway component GspD/PulD (secretin)